MQYSPLIDKYNRRIGSVRISLTDRCDLRCEYCMPEEGIEWLNRDYILTFEEILRVIRIFYQTGVRKFRLTGGEPTLRTDMVSLVEMIKQEFQDIDLALTTNGTQLDRLAKPLRKAGIDRVNISLDTLDHEVFEKLTRRDRLQQVISGIDAAIEAGMLVKINAVSIKTINDDEESLQRFVEFAEKKGVEVRFIELMPFTGNNWENQGLVTSKELREKLSRIDELIPLPMEDTSSTSRVWKLKNRNVRVGFVSSVSESFCDTCNRVRITADGKLRPCLHNAREYDLKGPMRNGATDEELLNIIRRGISEKWKEHPDFLALQYLPPVDDRAMIRIGG